MGGWVCVCCIEVIYMFLFSPTSLLFGFFFVCAYEYLFLLFMQSIDNFLDPMMCRPMCAGARSFGAGGRGVFFFGFFCFLLFVDDERWWYQHEHDGGKPFFYLIYPLWYININTLDVIIILPKTYYLKLL